MALQATAEPLAQFSGSISAGSASEVGLQEIQSSAIAGPSRSAACIARQTNAGDIDKPRRILSTGGSAAYYIKAEGLLPGPKTVDELAAWPDAVVAALRTAPRGDVTMRRLAAALEAGLVIHSDCSGHLSPECGLAMMMTPLAACGVKLPKDGLVFWRASDSSRLCQKVAKQSKCKPVHMFTDMLCKLPSKHRDIILKFRPAAMSDANAKTKAYRSMQEHLRKHASTLYGRDKRAGNCIFHPGEDCRLSWEDPDVGEHCRPLTAAVAGPPCRPWCLYGGRKTYEHEDLEAYHLWKEDVVNNNYDLIFLENSEFFPPELFVEGLPSKYVFVYAAYGVQDMGWPTRRTRFYGAAVNTSSLVWLGAGLGDVLQSFLSVFQRSVSLEGDCFAGLDSAEAILDVRRHLAHNRGTYPTDAQLKTISVKQLLPVASARAFDAMEAQFKQGVKVGMSGSFIGDLSQSDERIRAGAWLPSMTQSAILYSFNKDTEHITTHTSFPSSMDQIAALLGEGSKLYQNLFPFATHLPFC